MMFFLRLFAALFSSPVLFLLVKWLLPELSKYSMPTVLFVIFIVNLVMTIPFVIVIDAFVQRLSFRSSWLPSIVRTGATIVALLAMATYFIILTKINHQEQVIGIYLLFALTATLYRMMEYTLVFLVRKRREKSTTKKPH
jgi:hypothetical protein